MRRFFVLITLATSIATASQAAFLHAAHPLKDRYIVTLKDLPASDVDRIADQLARQFSGRLLGTMTHAMKGFAIAMSDEQAHALAMHPAVALVEEDEPVELSDVPPFDLRSQSEAALRRLRPGILSNNCPWTGSWYQCTFSDDSEWNLDQLDNQGQVYSTKAYAYNTTGNGVRAYIVDTGIWGTHQEFDTRVESGANMMADPAVSACCYPNEEPAVAQDFTPANNPCNGFNGDYTVGHGTAVASVLGGTNTGVAKHVTLIPVKIYNCQDQSSLIAVARGLDWILSDMQTPPHNSSRAVVNLSFVVNTPTAGSWVCEDGYGGYVNCIGAMENEINNVIGANIPVVAAAGNDNANMCATQSPARMGYGNEANYPSTHRTITVGGIMYDAAHSSYAQQRWVAANQPGGTDVWSAGNPGSNYGACVSIWAPAWNIRVAGTNGPTDYRSQWPTGIAGPREALNKSDGRR